MAESVCTRLNTRYTSATSRNAGGGTRTPTLFRAPGPKPGPSTSSGTPAGASILRSHWQKYRCAGDWALEQCPSRSGHRSRAAFTHTGVWMTPRNTTGRKDVAGGHAAEGEGGGGGQRDRAGTDLPGPPPV